MYEIPSVYDKVRIRLDSIYRWMDLPKELEEELDIAYHGHRLVSDFPGTGIDCPLYLEVDTLTPYPEVFAKMGLEAVLSSYGMHKKEDFLGSYYS